MQYIKACNETSPKNQMIKGDVPSKKHSLNFKELSNAKFEEET